MEGHRYQTLLYSNSLIPYWICLFVNRKINAENKLKESNLAYIIKLSSNLIPSFLRYLPSVDISGSYLLCTNLRYADLSFSIVDNTMLQNSTLAGANLFHTSMKNADVSFCDLMSANLSHVDAVGTDFHGSVLIHANLSNSNHSYSNLENCNLYSADLKNTVLINVNIENERTLFAVRIGPITFEHGLTRRMLAVLDADFDGAVINSQEIVDHLRSLNAINVPDAITDKVALKEILSNRGFAQEQINELLNFE